MSAGSWKKISTAAQGVLADKQNLFVSKHDLNHASTCKYVICTQILLYMVNILVMYNWYIRFDVGTGSQNDCCRKGKPLETAGRKVTCLNA